MKLKLFSVVLIATTILAGCASSHKLTMPKGRWQAVNQAGFIPAKAERYYINDDSESEQVQTELNEKGQ